MKTPIVFRPAARLEYDKAICWYENRRSGLGRRFHEAVERTLTSISENPELNAEVLRGAREAFVIGFPYCIYYRIEKARIVVFSVFHTARDPEVWQERL